MHGHEHRNGFAFMERDRSIGPRELPIHRECGECPIGFDNAIERTNRIFGHIRWPAYHEVPIRGRSEQEWNGERENAVSEMGRSQIGLGAFQVLDVDAFDFIGPVPRRPNGMGRNDEPASLIGNEQRQAAIGKAVACFGHPLTLNGGNGKLGRSANAGVKGGKRKCLDHWTAVLVLEVRPRVG